MSCCRIYFTPSFWRIVPSKDASRIKGQMKKEIRGQGYSVALVSADYVSILLPNTKQMNLLGYYHGATKERRY